MARISSSAPSTRGMAGTWGAPFVLGLFGATMMGRSLAIRRALVHREA